MGGGVARGNGDRSAHDAPASQFRGPRTPRSGPLAPLNSCIAARCPVPALPGGVAISRIIKRLFPGRPGDTPGPKLGAFGKHPAFDDHLEDPGLASAALIDARRILYADAIRANIDSGAWERLDPAQRVEGWDHTFLWSLSRSDDILLTGRLLPSRDAKGRDKYPLVLCAELRSSTALSAIPSAIRRLDELSTECAAAATRAEFVAALDAARAGAASIIGFGEQSPPIAQLTGSIVNAGSPGEGHAPFARCLYALGRELSPVADRQTASGTGHVRLPAPGLNDAQALTAWVSIIHRWLPELRGVLLMKPRAQAWLDALVPIPLPAQLTCIRTAASLVPLACDVPYNLDAQFARRARDFAASLM